MSIHCTGLRSPVLIFTLMSTVGIGVSTLSLASVSSSPLAAEQNYFDVKGSAFFEKTQTIFVGKLLSKESFRTPDGRFILTRHRFAVQETLKGNPQDRLEIIEYGGTLGEMTMRVSHGPHYLVGQEYLVFSYIDLLKHNRTLAGPMGQFRIVRDGQDRRVIRVYSSHPVLQVLDRGKTGVFQDLTTFSSRLRQAVQGVPDEKK